MALVFLNTQTLNLAKPKSVVKILKVLSQTLKALYIKECQTQ